MSLVKNFDFSYEDEKIGEVCFGVDGGELIEELFITVDNYIALGKPTKVKVTIEVVDV